MDTCQGPEWGRVGGGLGNGSQAACEAEARAWRSRLAPSGGSVTQAFVTPGRTQSTTGPDTDILEGSRSNSSGFAHSETCDVIPNAICSSNKN